MRNQTQSFFRLFFLSVFAFLAFFLFPLCGWAGGPLTVVPSTGVPSVWISPISLDPEAGTCGTFSNAAMLTKIDENVDPWEDVVGIDLDFSINSGVITVDVNLSNYNTYYVDSPTDTGLTDNLNPVVFDDDGQIVTDLFGLSAEFTVLGFAGPSGFSTDITTILDGQAFFNCRCLSGNPAGDCNVGSSTIVFTEDDLNYTMTHEIGHMINLDHSQVGQAIAEAGCDTDVVDDCNNIATMYPESVDPADQITPQRDDEVAVLSLYGASGWSSALCTVTGSLTDKDGDIMRCADVQAQTSDAADTISFISGGEATYEDLNGDGASDGDGECLTKCGAFTLRGLSPSKTYSIKVKPVDFKWVGGSSVGPCRSSQIPGILEEEIATVSGCTAGSTVSLGTIQTLSDVESDSGNGGNGSSNKACGDSQNFENCDALIDCSLSPCHRVRIPPILPFMLVLPLIFLVFMRFFSKRQKTDIS